MVKVPMGSTTMDLLPLLCLCVLTRFGSTLADGPGVLVAVQEGSDAILPCSISTKENIEKKVFDWKKEDDKKEVFLYDAGSYYGSRRTGQDEQFKDRVFHFKDELKNGNASIRITKTKMADNGSYTCTFPNQQTSYITLIVDPDPNRSILRDRTAENITGAAKKPSITSLTATKDWTLLQCEVHDAFPKPTLKWQDGSGNIIPAEEAQVIQSGDSYEVTLKTTVRKTDRYRCVATQEELKHLIYADTDVYIAGTPVGLIAGVAVLGVFLVFGIIAFVIWYRKTNSNKQKSSPDY